MIDVKPVDDGDHEDTRATPVLPILRCSAGGVPLGLAAEEVTEFRPANTIAPHLATLLGLPPAADAAGGAPEIRTLRLRSGDGEALVRVDGPVRIRPLDTADLLSVPRLLMNRRRGPVIGFCAEEGRVVVLVDVGELLRLAAAAADGQRVGGARC